MKAKALQILLLFVFPYLVFLVGFTMADDFDNAHKSW